MSSTIVFAEPESHTVARQMIGARNFHGIDTLERLLGPLADEEREARRELRLRDHRTGLLLSEEQTLSVVEQCRGTHILLATKPLALTGLHAVHHKGFTNERVAPWFTKPAERQAWSGIVIRDPWLLVRKDVLPGSAVKDIHQQQQYLVREHPHERSLLPVEYCFAAVVHWLRAGEHLCPNHVIRFPVWTADGGWVIVYRNGDRLHVGQWSPYADKDVGMATARTSS